MMDKQRVLDATNGGLDVFRHFLGSRFPGVGKAFKSPFYKDTKASCYVYYDEKAGIYKFKDFGDASYSGDCFFFVGEYLGLNCQNPESFVRILKHIDSELALGGEQNPSEGNATPTAPIPKSKPTVTATQLIDKPRLNADCVSESHESIECAVIEKPFSLNELAYWKKYGVRPDDLERFGVISLASYRGTSKSGKSIELISTEEEPIFGYRGERFVKLYRPFSKLRFLFTGEKPSQYVFGKDQLPLRGDFLFITGGEKDVISLSAHGFHAISLNSETDNLPKRLLKTLHFRFRHVVLLYDVDATGLKSMSALLERHKEFELKSVVLPLSGEKNQKDISDFFALGHTREDFQRLLLEMIERAYEDSMAIMQTCEIDFSSPPLKPEPLVTIGSATLATPGNLLCVAGAEGSGKTNFLGGLISGSIKPIEADVDTFGLWIQENPNGKGVLLYDTEQSEYQLYKNLTYIVKRSSLDKPPAWFKAYGLVGVSRTERLKLITESLDAFYHRFSGIHMVVIDGVGDLLASVNEEEGSVALIEELMRLAAIYQTVIVCVLHMAPSGLKLRGHLGSEMQRKAAGIVLIEKDEHTDHSLIKALKVRDGSPLEAPILEFGWSPEKGRHEFKGEKGRNETTKRHSIDLKTLAKEVFSDQVSMSSKELAEAIAAHLQIKDRMARNYIQYMKENGILEKSKQFPGRYCLLE